ncbi:cell division ATP-binding protein FtsE [Candidatus Peregrinibacteria bacterium RIFOXYC2_FULL_33_13]|nr:MAG: Cell division ATP-binding protein FtsE [Candidatus Peregrinibacteria bacterium GW2011_GWA2_33_10]KKP41098.1 MAG: cell division ATP-binding protein FtsE, cell division transport system ATP-binding protein [Candidatus Peregrinibacteria bacterium GW2011_GWC2_33_13]OGJ49811.1 MAG: cell division ATP-binding protein FtsE [Candidatus Peregrinibacteria bacterium RIFOXYA2_FULL_33_7]OGJ52108.1 MAG: cell division ATP-binding protein FtsE [Candidatus Peregrinibacteria bacterium RIFOXYC2_FULL_33_13]
MIIYQNIHKRYHTHSVLEDINLKIEGNEFVSITGPSGAGKSTLINLLIGSEKPTSGLVSIDGYDISKMKNNVLQFFRRKIGIVFQDYKLLPKKTVYENVAFAMEVCGYNDQKIKQRVPKLLEIVGLENQMDLFPCQLSGGENQRVSLARALMHNPKLIIADEPTGNLDPDNSKEIIQLLLKLNSFGVTVMLATHDREIVNSIQKRVIRLDKGRIIADEKRSGYDLYTLPNNYTDTIRIKEEILTQLHID